MKCRPIGTEFTIKETDYTGLIIKTKYRVGAHVEISDGVCYEQLEPLGEEILGYDTSREPHNCEFYEGEPTREEYLQIIEAAVKLFAPPNHPLSGIRMFEDDFTKDLRNLHEKLSEAGIGFEEFT